MSKMNIAPQDRPRVKSECLRLLATLQLDPARMQLISGFIDSYLRLNAQEQAIFQTEIAQFEPTQQEVVMQIVTSWMEEGIQQGELKIIQRQLTRRIGEIKPELQEQVRRLSSTQLEDLAEALLDFSTESDLVAWLQQSQ
jgi:predicted RNA-binding protein with PIN domain